MDLIEMKPDVDPLDLQEHDNTYEIGENKASSEIGGTALSTKLINIKLPKEGTSSHLKVTWIKTEYVNDGYDVKREIKVEDSPEPTSFAFMTSEVDEDFFDVDRVQQEQKVEVSSEEGEVFPESCDGFNQDGT
ncbi:uncharacterized protein [Periplaneta americana]|uniref:uncharacterized protein isoform X6 n=1 Tax=Periplaneta americana TaxID=6978 RepID=UPI0037E89ED9